MTITKFTIDVNENKYFDTAPDLIAFIELEKKPLELAIWTRRTRDGSKIYHSASLSEPFCKGQKPQVFVKGVKLYEFRRTAPTDPDFQSKERFKLFGLTVWLAMWMDERDDKLIIEGALVDRPFEQKLAPNVEAFIRDLRSRYHERLVESERGIEPEPDFEANEEIPF
jgi:hypothetical protein